MGRQERRKQSKACMPYACQMLKSSHLPSCLFPLLLLRLSHKHNVHGISRQMNETKQKLYECLCFHFVLVYKSCGGVDPYAEFTRERGCGWISGLDTWRKINKKSLGKIGRKKELTPYSRMQRQGDCCDGEVTGSAREGVEKKIW